MIEIKTEIETSQDVSSTMVPFSFHSGFYHVYENIKKWISRFPLKLDSSLLNDLLLFYFSTSKNYLNHRHSTHLFRLILSGHMMQKKLLHQATFFSSSRHIYVRWIPATLSFPFSTRPVLGCLIGFNVLDKYELFDEENVFLTLQKQLPNLRIVKESAYQHRSQHKNLKIIYFEIEKLDGKSFSLKERNLLRNNIEEKVKKSIQKLSPALFVGNNEEEVYKNILVLSQEIQSSRNIPQASINLDQQTGKEIVFRVTLVYISPYPHFSLKDHFRHCNFVTQRLVTVKQIESRSIEAHIFHLYLQRDASILRSDGSLDFYSARQKVVALIKEGVGEIRDFNGGIIIKQREMFLSFKERFGNIDQLEPELLETFFYSLMPLEKQALLDPEILASVFNYFFENKQHRLEKDLSYSLKVYHEEKCTYLIAQGSNSSFSQTISIFLKEQSFRAQDIAYNIMETPLGFFFNCVFLQDNASYVESFIQLLQQSLHQWNKKVKNKQVLRIALEHKPISLDPRIGAEGVSDEILKLLFEGLTRYNQNGNIENAVAESIEISPNGRLYTFKLRPTLWNDGSPVTAFDFEYAWKKVLSPSFSTAFAYIFYSIKNAKEAKEGKVSLDQVGIQVVDDRTLKVELIRPTPYFLQLTSRPLCSPIHRKIDQQYPLWPHQCEKNYPCNGPFQLEVNQPGQGYQLIKNPYYWNAEHISFDQVNLTQLNPDQAFQAFTKREIDWIGNPFGSFHSFYIPNKGSKIVSIPDIWAIWCVFNTTYPPFNNLKLRQAFNYAINRSQIISKAFVPLKTAYSPLSPHHRKNLKPLFHDTDQMMARWLFQEALEELNLNIKDFNPITFIYYEKGVREITALCLQKQFKDCLNIDIELKPLAWDIAFHQMTKGNFQMCLLSWISWTDDPLYTLDRFRFADQATNFSKWEHSGFQRLLDLGERELDPFKRSNVLHEAEKILCEEMPAIPLFYQPIQALVQNDLHIITQNQASPYNVARTFNKKRQ
jgi:oligopeptide transport system substrate-binding protein